MVACRPAELDEHLVGQVRPLAREGPRDDLDRVTHVDQPLRSRCGLARAPADGRDVADSVRPDGSPGTARRVLGPEFDQ